MASNQKVQIPQGPDTDEKGPVWKARPQREDISDSGRKWLEENAEAIKGWSDYVEANGLPPDKYR